MKKEAYSQEFGRIPNMAFYLVIKNYAFFKGLPFLTWKDQAAAFDMYIDIAKRLN